MIKRFFAILLIGYSVCNAIPPDSTIGNLTPTIVVGDTWRVPWENPAVLDYYITFQNLTNQILAGMASQAYVQNVLTNPAGLGPLLAAWNSGNIPLLNGVNFFLNNNEFAAGVQFDSTVTVQGNLLDGGTLNVGSTGSVSPTNQFEVHAAGGMFNLGTNGVLYLNGLQIGSGGTNVTIINNPVYFTTNIIVGGGTTSTNLYVYDILGALRLQVDTNGTKFFGNAGPTTISNLNVLSPFTIDGTSFYDWLASAGGGWTNKLGMLQPSNPSQISSIVLNTNLNLTQSAAELVGALLDPANILGYANTEKGDSPYMEVFFGTGTSNGSASSLTYAGDSGNAQFNLEAVGNAAAFDINSGSSSLQLTVETNAVGIYAGLLADDTGIVINSMGAYMQFRPGTTLQPNYSFETIPRSGTNLILEVKNGASDVLTIDANGLITGTGIGGGITLAQLQGSTNTATLHAQGLALTSEVVTNNDTRPTVLDNTLLVNGSVGANAFYGDGSGLSNLPPSVASSVAASNILVGAAGGQLPVGGLYDITTNEAGFLLVSSGGSRHRTYNGGSLTNIPEAGVNGLVGDLSAITSNLTSATNDLSGVLKARMDSGTNDLSTALKARMDAGTNDLSTVLKARMDSGTNDLNTALVAKIQAATNAQSVVTIVTNNLPAVLTNAISQALYTPYQITPTSTSGGPATNVLVDPVNGNYQYVVSGTNYYISCAAPVSTSGGTVRLDLWLSNTCAITISAAYLESNSPPVFTYSTSNINVLLFDHPYPCGKSTNYWKIFQLAN